MPGAASPPTTAPPPKKPKTCSAEKKPGKPPPPPAADQDADAGAAASSLSPAALLEACAAGGDVIVLRAPLRTARLFAEELQAAAGRVGLPPSMLRCLSPGLWLLTAAAAAAEAGAMGAESAARTALLLALPRLGGVRLVGNLLAAATQPAQLVEAARSRLADVRRAPRWALHYEVHYPAAEHSMIPFVRMHATPGLLLRMGAALGDGFIDGFGDGAEAAASGTPPSAAASGAPPSDVDPPPSDVDRLVLLHCKNGLLLLRDQQLPRPPPAEASVTLALAAPGGGGVRLRLGTRPAPPRPHTWVGASEEEAEAWHLPWWLSPWATRSFAFSASLDPLIAIAAVNLAAAAHHARHGRAAPSSHSSSAAADGAQRLAGRLRDESLPLAGLRVYDPCCGSGTVLAAALAQGAAGVAGSDLRRDFLEGARGNLSEVGLLTEATRFFVHDATLPLPPSPPLPPARAAGAVGGGGGGAAAAAADAPRCELVVSNPPWGKKIGKAEDGGPIVSSMVRQFPGATMVWVVNKQTRIALEGIEGLKVLQVLKLGGVEAVLATA